MCGLPPHGGIDGQSFSSVVNDPSLGARKAALTQVCRPWPKGEIEQMGYSLRSEQFRYTQWVDFKTGDTLFEELYDHSADPLERKNVVNDSGQQSNLTHLRHLMKLNR